MQNTIVKEFENDPRVITAVMSQAQGSHALERFWRNIYLRGPMLYDPTGAVAGGLYGQPETGLPFSRAFVIGPDQTVVLPYFGHNPDLIMNTIYELLAGMPPLGDVDGDGDVDLTDLSLLLTAYGSCVGDPAYNPDADFDDNGCVDLADLAMLLANYGR